MQSSFFDDIPQSPIQLAQGAVVLPRFVGDAMPSLYRALKEVVTAAPFRHLITPGGHKMSVGMTNCGSAGWVSDASGYRYSKQDPMTGNQWPNLPDCFLELAQSAAAAAGYAQFETDACLINQYRVGAKLSMHQDRDEGGLEQPIVSVSLGLPATFLFGGLERTDPTRKVLLEHGDVVVWGGPSRLCFHAVNAIQSGVHPDLGPRRLNLTFRKAV
ncbi:DNA oxidative demethylase AlkB [Falsihalocynthiibacter sp. BN13B15]